MKKSIVFLVILMLVFGMIPWNTSTVYAYEQNTELLENTGFEQSDTSMWTARSCILSRDSANKKSGSYSMKVTDRKIYYSSAVQNITSILQQCGQGAYSFSAYMKLLTGESETPMYVVISITDDNTKPHWYTGNSATITSSAFTQSKNTSASISWEGTLKEALIYIQNADNTLMPALYLDDFSLIKTGAIGDPILTSDYISTPQTIAKRDTGDPAVGAIRWDAWLPTTNSVGAQVARSLSPSKYHFRLPYYSIVLSNTDDDDSNDVDYPPYSQTLMDNEIRYAEYAGIDYWAYCWYPIGSGMDTARNRHVSSGLRDKVKMCAILNVNPFGDAERAQLVDYMSQSFYMKVQGGRPLLFFFGSSDSLATIIAIQQDCLAKGIPMPYCVSMGGVTIGMDAVSNYAIGGSNGQTFSSLAASAESNWNSQKSSRQVIPLVTTGWDPRPRYDHPVTWTTVSANSWAQTATASQIAAHLQNGINWTKNNSSSTLANAVLMYAWNEHDEGGWLCPTVKVDSNGNVLKQANGLNQVNTERVDALHTLLNNAAPTVNPWSTPVPTIKPTATPAPTQVPTVKPTNYPTGYVQLTPTAAIPTHTLGPGETAEITATNASTGQRTLTPQQTAPPEVTVTAADHEKKTNSVLPIAAGAVTILLCGGIAAAVLITNKKK